MFVLPSPAYLAKISTQPVRYHLSAPRENSDDHDDESDDGDRKLRYGGKS
jgi:hypothetical protein